MSGAKHESDGAEHQKPVTLLEKIATTISALVVALLLAVLVRDALRSDAPPRLTVEVGRADSVGASYRVPATLHNRGDKSAKSVVVHFELVIARNDSVAAESDVTIDWLPGESSRDVVGLFRRDAAGERANVRADVRGYVAP
jgi:uncharacterized protein (TIGR02588 family)